MDDDERRDQTPSDRVSSKPSPPGRRARTRTTTSDWRAITPIIGPVRKGRDPLSELYRLTHVDVRRTVDWLKVAMPGVPRELTTEDLVQGFYGTIAKRHAVHALDRTKGRLGAWVAVSVRNYVRDAARRAPLPLAPLDDERACARRIPADRIVEGMHIVSLANQLRPGWERDYEAPTQELTRRSANRMRQRRHQGRKATERAIRSHRGEGEDEPTR